MAKSPPTPQQQAQSVIDSEKRAAAVAAALEKLRNQLDPTRAATIQLAEEQKKSAESAGLFAGRMRSVLGGFQSIAALGGTPTQAIAAFGGQVSQLVSTMGPAGTVAGAFVSVASQLPQLFKSAADSVANYVQAFSPLTAQRYSRAWADLSASIGQTLMPVLDAATSVVRYFGDTIAGLNQVLGPLVRDVVNSLKPAFTAVGSVFRDMIRVGVILYEVFKPVLNVLVQIADFLNPFSLFVTLIGKLAPYITLATNALALFLGIDLNSFQGGSQGKAAAQSTGMTSASAMLDELRKRAFQLGSGGEANDPVKQQLAVQLRIAQLLSNLSIESIGAAIGSQVASAANQAIRAIGVLISTAIDKIPVEVVKGITTALGQTGRALNAAQAGAGIAANALGFQIPPAMSLVMPRF